MEFEEEFKNYKIQIENALKEYLERERKRAITINLANVKIIDFIMDFCLRGGKRIRPILFIKGYQAVGGKNIKEIIRTSICIELLEAYLLIHDDIIDQAKKRRGGPTFHKMCEVWKNDIHFGISSAIIAGDMISNLATKVIIESNFKKELKLKALSEFVQAELDCFHGELYDVILEKQNKIKEIDFLKMVSLKTASYTTQAPLIMGAILGEAKESQIEILRKYGALLGEAFQIIDDLLGTYGDEAVTGKSVDSDIKQGKKTLFLIHALKHAKKEDKDFLQKIWGNKNLTTNDINKVKNILIKTGSMAYSKNEAQKLTNQAKTILQSGNFKPETKIFLDKLTDFIIERKF